MISFFLVLFALLLNVFGALVDEEVLFELNDDVASSDENAVVWGNFDARVQHEAPRFRANALVDGKIQQFELDSLLGQYTVIVFYPADFSFVCVTEVNEYSDAFDAFAAANARVVAVSTDSAFVHDAWAKTARAAGGVAGVRIPLVADQTHEIARAYGVLLEDGADRGLAARATIVLDAQHKVRAIGVNDLPVGRSVDETLRLVKAFQHADKKGTVCPAGFQSGDADIVPDPTKKLEFFEQKYAAATEEI